MKAEEKIIRVLENKWGTVYLTDKQSAFGTLINDPITASLFIKLCSLTLELPTAIGLTVKRNWADPIPTNEAIGKVLSPLLEGNTKQAKKEFIKLPHFNQRLLYYVFTQQLLRVGRLYILDNLPTFYSLSSLLANWIPLPESLETEFESIFSITKTSNLDYPFILYKTPKKHKWNFGYVLHTAKKSVSNISSKKIREFLESGLHLGGRICLWRRLPNSRRYQVIPLAEGTDTAIKDYIRGNGTIPLSSFGNLTLNRAPNIEVLRFKGELIEKGADLHKHTFHTRHKYLLLSSEGVFEVHPKVRKRLVKIADFDFNEAFEPVGFIYHNSAADPTDLRKVPYKITDKLLRNGIDDAYLPIHEWWFNNDELLQVTAGALIYGFYKPCKVCGELYSKLEQGLCSKHHRMLRRIAMSHIDNEFTTTLYSVKPFEVHIDKYKIIGDGREAKFVKEYRGRLVQVLPFDYTDW